MVAFSSLYLSFQRENGGVIYNEAELGLKEAVYSSSLAVPFVIAPSLLLLVALNVSLSFCEPEPPPDASGVPAADTAAVDRPSATEEAASSGSASSE